MIFFILVGGAPGTIWDHIKPKNGRKKGPKKSQKRAKIGQDRPRKAIDMLWIEVDPVDGDNSYIRLPEAWAPEAWVPEPAQGARQEATGVRQVSDSPTVPTVPTVRQWSDSPTVSDRA